MDCRNDQRDVPTLPLLAVLAAVAACAPKYHTAAPYRFDPANARDVVAEAIEHCRESSPEETALPPKPFVTDGCSSWPDGVWQRCCVEHDMRYWCGGTRAQRREADAALRTCVAASPGFGVSVVAPIMRAGVAIGGAPCWPFYWRWGYGHPWPRGYRREDPR